MCGKTFPRSEGRGRRRVTCGQRCRKRLSRVAFPNVMVCERRWVRADGKRPVTPGGGAASSTDPDTWFSFRDVQSGAGDGFGFMLGGGFGCIDVDHCVSDAGLTDVAANVLDSNPGAFVERSVSGAGLHVFGWLPERGGSRRGGVEVYSRGRFIRTTGLAFRRGGMVPLCV